MGSLGDKRGKFKDLQIAATKYKFSHFKKANSSQDVMSIKYQLSLNFKCTNQMEGMECSEKICNARNWNCISLSVGAKMLNFNTFMTIAVFNFFRVN